MIKVTSAPVLTLRDTGVAESLDHYEALTLGRAVAGLSAHAKGRRLGIFEPSLEHLKQRLVHWERVYNISRPNGAFNRKTNYDTLSEKL